MRNKFHPLLTLASTLTFFFFFSSPLDARFLNLNGIAELSFSDLKTTGNNTKTSNETFQQRYSIGSYGDLGIRRIGSYNANFTFNQQDPRTNGGDQGSLRLKTYNLNMNLLPRWYPLSIYANRTVTENEFHQLTKNTTDSYGLAWVLSTRYVPRLSLNLSQTDTESSSGALTSTRSLALSTSKSIGPASLSAGYQLSEVDTGGVKTRFHSYSLGLSGGLPFSLPLVNKEDLTIGLRANYTTNVAAASASPGLAISQERSAGADLHYRPNLVWNTNFSYDFSQTPLPGTDLNRHIATANLNIRPTGNIDLNSSYRLLVFNISNNLISTRTLSHFLIAGLNYRPIFGLSTGINTSLGLTDVFADKDSETISQNYNYYINYNKAFELIQFNTGYSLTYGNTKTEPSGQSNSNIIHNINLGLSNTRTRIVRVSFNYTFTDIDSSLQDSQISNTFSLSADSSYFRNILLFGDSLYLSGSTSYTNTQMIGETITYSTNATYNIRGGMSLNSGYTHSGRFDLSSADQDTYFGEVQWNTYLFRRVGLTMSLRDSVQKTGTGGETDTREARSTLNYRIGKLTLNLEYRLTATDANGTENRTEFIYLRATRPF